MKFKTTEVAGTVEILASKDYSAIPAKIVSNETVVRAGMPISAEGTPVPSGSGAVGILLYDVYPEDNPNCALIVFGIVDWTKCMDHSGATASAATMKDILPGITFRENIGVNEGTTTGG